MKISSNDYHSIGLFIDSLSQNEDTTPLFEDQASLEALRQAIKAPTIQHTKLAFSQYRIRYIDDAKKHLSHETTRRVFEKTFLSSPLSQALCLKVKHFLQFDEQIGGIQKQLSEERWSEEEIQDAIKTYSKNGVFSENPIYSLRELCRNTREKAALTQENTSEWISWLTNNHVSSDKKTLFERSARFSSFFEGSAKATDIDYADLKYRLRYMDLLGTISNRFHGMIDEGIVAELRHHKAFLTHYPESLSQHHLSAFNHIEYVTQELLSKTYSKETTLFVLQTLLRMTSLGVRRETIQDYLALTAVKTEPMTQVPRENTVAGTISIIPGPGGSPIAKVRTDSWSHPIKHEVLAYNVDHALGSSFVPPAILPKKDKLIQKYIDNGQQLDIFLATDPLASSQIKSMNKDEVQAYLLFGLIRGRGDGHGANTIIVKGKNGSFSLRDIDEEDDFLFKNLHLSPVEANEGPNTSNIAALGFPQGAAPMSLVITKLFSWDGLAQKAWTQLRNQKMAIQSEALRERIEKIVTVVVPEKALFFQHLKTRFFENLMGTVHRHPKICRNGEFVVFFR